MAAQEEEPESGLDEKGLREVGSLGKKRERSPIEMPNTSILTEDWVVLVSVIVAVKK